MEINFTLLEITWVAIGFTFARAYGKKFDYSIKRTSWFSKLSPWKKYLVSGLLNFLHHWWIGLLIYLYGPTIEIQMFGLGIFLDDIPDIPPRFRKYFSYLFQGVDG